VRTRTLARLPLSYKRLVVALAGVGLALLLVPTSGCGVTVRAWTAEALAAPADTPPQLDDAEVARDAQAVSAAQAALAAWRPAPAATASSRPTTTSRTRTVPADPKAVAAAQERVDAAQDDVDADQAELDRLLAEQESSSDPASYDGDVAAAREQLEASVAVLEEARADLAAAKASGRTVTETVTASPRPEPVVTPTADGRAALTAALAEARTQQSAHLAARQKAVADWRAGHQEELGRVAAHNARVKECGSRAAVPGTAGLVCLLLAAAGGAAHTVRGRLTP
jgi:hypothetical protein